MDGSDRYSQYNSPYAGGGYEEGPLDQVRYFLEDHGKKIVALIVLLVAVYFIWSVFIGNSRNVTIKITNTENESLSGATVTITRTGESKPAYTGTPGTVPLRTGDYTIDITASGYRPVEGESLTVAEDNATQSYKLEKGIVTKIMNLQFPGSLYLGQQATGSISLQNPGSKEETIELVFEKDLVDLLKKNFSIQTTPSTIVVPAGGALDIPLAIQVPTGITLKNKNEGDAKQGLVRIKYTNASEAKKEFSFQLLPEAKVQVTPTLLQKTIVAGADQTSLGKITIKNNSDVEVTNIAITVEMDSTAPSGASTWFSFDTTQLDSLAANSKEDIQMYLSPPANPNTQKIAGQSHIIVKGTGWQQTIPLDLTITGVTAAVTAQLSNASMSIQKDGADYQTKIAKVAIKNDGGVAISEVELSVSSTCLGDWIVFDQGNTVENLSPKGTTQSSKEISFQVTAPPNASSGLQTCSFQVKYTNPLTGEDVIQDTTPAGMRITTTE